MQQGHRLLAVMVVVVLLLFEVWTGDTVAQDVPAELILRGGKIVTLDDDQPIVRSLATRDGRVVALGSDAKVGKLVGDGTQVIDLAGRLVVPGFIEGHGHLTALGQSKMVLDLTKAKTWDDIIHQVEAAARVTPRGRWILGRGWHQSKWTRAPTPNIDGYPMHARLSEVSPHNPVLLTHASGHMSFANRMAMGLGGVDLATADPDGGEIVRDPRGEPIGVFRETAQAAILRAQSRDASRRPPDERKQELISGIHLAIEDCLAKGVTSFQDAGSGFSTIDVFKEMAEREQLEIRLWVMVRASNEEFARKAAAYRMVGFGNNHLTVRAVKRSLDGALGTHGAWLLLPYEDLPGSVGLATSPPASVRETARIAIENDYQLCVHAIGDRANREALNIFEEAFQTNPSRQPRRWRVEHAQHLHPDDIPRFQQLGVIASMQGVHCTSDAPYVIERLGYRRASQGAYVWQSLLKSGAVVTNGTDTPVEDVGPIQCFYATVTRKLATGEAFFPEQKLSRTEALRSYTQMAAYAAFEEDIKGTLSVGKLADVVVLSKDIMTIPDEEILDTKVLYTIIGGKVVFQSE